MDNLIIKPYNYLLSFTEYITIHDTNNISNIITKISDNTYNSYEIINDTIETSTSINDINNKSLSDITFNDIIYIIYEYKIFISIITLFSIITFYFMNKLIDDYFIKLDNKNNKNNKNNKHNTLKINNFNTINTNKLHNQKPIEIQNIINNKTTFITKGLFIDSILDIDANHKNISEKIMINEENNNYFYYALLRIKLKNHITLNKTNYNIETIIVNTDNYAETFTTGDMYMIIKFHHNHNYTDIKLSQIIVNVMNILNNLSQDTYKNEDFIVLAISKDTQIHNNINPNEFYKGLLNINYDLCNVKHINLNKDNTIGFLLLLPVKQIYELFLDVYNDIIFESTSYKIDFDNNEYWYNNSINDIF